MKFNEINVNNFLNNLLIFQDNRINKILGNWLKYCLNDEEFSLRFDENFESGDFNILKENIIKTLIYVNSDYNGELRLNSNIWWICYECLCDILSLFDLKFIGEEKITENELVIKK